MYALKNKVQLIGNLGKDPQVTTTQEGKKMARFSMATHDSYRNQNGEKVQQTEWHNLVAWGKIAELAEKMLSKGKEIAVEGKLTHKRYTDKNGVNRAFTEIQVSELLMLGSKQ